MADETPAIEDVRQAIDTLDKAGADIEVKMKVSSGGLVYVIHVDVEKIEGSNG
jgi:hypothetical protein